MIETSLIVKDYPTPPENNKEIEGTIILEIPFKDEFPKDWTRDEIISHIRSNIIDYISFDDFEIDEIDF